jgi:hypothetical protein
MMKAGVIGQVHGDFDGIDTKPFPMKRNQGGVELQSTIDIEEVQQNKSGDTIITGFAGEQTESKRTVSSISDDGRVQTAENLEVRTDSTEFLCLPGEFVIVENSSKTYAFDLIGRATESAIEQVQLDLTAFAEDHEDEVFWMSGFYNTGGNADNGVAYGDDVTNDIEIGGVLQDSEKNRLGLIMEYNPEPLKLMLTESGYVEIYQPSEFGTLSFARFVQEELARYITTE